MSITHDQDLMDVFDRSLHLATIVADYRGWIDGPDTLWFLGKLDGSAEDGRIFNQSRQNKRTVLARRCLRRRVVRDEMHADLSVLRVCSPVE